MRRHPDAAHGAVREDIFEERGATGSRHSDHEDGRAWRRDTVEQLAEVIGSIEDWLRDAGLASHTGSGGLWL
jgi:hypothetical protein